MAPEKDLMAMRGRIIGLAEGGVHPKEIAVKLGVGRSTVYKWLKRLKDEKSLESDKRSGRGRITSEEEDSRIVEMAEKNPFIASTTIQQNIGVNLSKDTIRNRLHEAGFKSRTPAEKEMLTRLHKEKRLTFSENFVEKGLDYWARIIFTDEKTFSSTDHGKIRCWRRKNTRYDEKNIHTNARSGHVTCNMWGWIFMHGVGELCEIEGRFNSDKYLEILEEVMLPSVRSYAFPYPEKIIYMHDNSPIHKARKVTSWFNENNQYIDILEWPSRGCDLNPIENVWGVMVNQWEPTQQKTKKNLVHHTKKVWENLRNNQKYIYDIVGSMPRRLQSVIDKNGGWTKY